MKYLEEMTDKELIKLAKEEKILLGLFFNRENIIKKLITKGYLRKVEKNKKEDIYSQEKNDESKQIENKKTEIEIIDFSKVEMYRDRSRSYYRNFPNKKLFKKLKKIYTYKKNKNKSKNFDFKIERLNKRQIKSRETETEINKSKFNIGTESKNVYKKDVYFDSEELPSAYFVDEVVLMPKNLNTLYVYWEIREDTFERLRKNDDILENVIIKILKNGIEYKKIIRNERIGSHFITDIEYSGNYEAQIGYEDKKGNYKKVAISQKAMVPINKVSENISLTWGTVKLDKNTNQIIKYVTPNELIQESSEFLEMVDENYREYNNIIEKMRKTESSVVHIKK